MCISHRQHDTMTPRKKTCPCDFPIENQVQHFYPQIKKIGAQKKLRSRKAIFRKSPKCLTNFISECSRAILRRDIELTPDQYQQLSPFKQHLLFLSKSRPSLLEKARQIDNVKGGFLSLLPILGSILANTVLPIIFSKWQKH